MKKIQRNSQNFVFLWLRSGSEFILHGHFLENLLREWESGADYPRICRLRAKHENVSDPDLSLSAAMS